MQNLGPCAQTQRPSETVSSKRAISALTKEELRDEIVSLGERSFRADQIRDWLYKKNVQSFEEMANIPKALRTELEKRLIFRTLTLRGSLRSGDGTTKFLFELMDGLLIESVLIPEKDHMTLCISSQVGCAMGCIFCLTGKGGFKRNLTPHEIVDQVLEVKRWAPKRPAITNIVFM
ncbi:MAG: 23S rRNA (adenine(2503)-C(2))-methyltransferase RlmN, partial [Desulfatiglandales bacterium]